jgi:hypothetical protein
LVGLFVSFKEVVVDDFTTPRVVLEAVIIGDAILTLRLERGSVICREFNSLLKDFLAGVPFADDILSCETRGTTLLLLDVGRIFSWPGGGGGVD